MSRAVRVLLNLDSRHYAARHADVVATGRITNNCDGFLQVRNFSELQWPDISPKAGILDVQDSQITLGSGQQQFFFSTSR